MIKQEKMKTIQEINQAGIESGADLASWIELPETGQTLPRHIDWFGIGEISTDQDRQEAFLMLCHDAEQSQREFSPFEFTAKEFNSHEDPEEAWAAYETGLQLGFERNYSERVTA